jgi:hypothetical protein
MGSKPEAPCSGQGPISKRPWYNMDSQCIYCGSDEFHAGWGPATLVMCSACSAGGVHVGCYEGATGMTMSEDVLSSGSTWFCSEVSQHAGIPGMQQRPTHTTLTVVLQLQMSTQQHDVLVLQPSPSLSCFVRCTND